VTEDIEGFIVYQVVCL